MSTVSKFLLKIGVPKALLDYGQELIGKWKAEAVKLVPTAAEVADSVKRQAMFKQGYRLLSPEARAGVDAMLETICAACLVKVKKALSL